MSTLDAPGLRGDWLNGWLAGVGVTVLVPGCRLSWTSEPVPVARLSIDGDGGVIRALTAAFPTAAQMASLSIARRHPDSSEEMVRRVTPSVYSSRAGLARRQRDWMLEMSVTDLASPEDGTIPHAPFDRPAPRGTTIHDRGMACRNKMHDLSEELTVIIERALGGHGLRVQSNGLGFDFTRGKSASHHAADVHVDPVIECLCLYGLRLFPVRGDGRRLRQRGWSTSNGARQAFRWPVWSFDLVCWAVDALLDRFHSAAPEARAGLHRLGVTGAFRSVEQKRRGSSDTYWAYAAERVW